MKKQERKEKANKGFSLVELIVVVAIMAVLAVVIAPQYLRYVEKTRVQKDESAVAEFVHAVEIAIADEKVYTSLGLNADNPTITVTAPDGAAFTDGTSELLAELNATFGTTFDYTSSAYDGDDYTVTITYDATTKGVTVKGAWPTSDDDEGEE